MLKAFQSQSSEVGITIIPILQRKKLRLRQVR